MTATESPSPIKAQWVCKACHRAAIRNPEGTTESWTIARSFNVPTVWTFCPHCEAKYKGQKVTVRLTAEEAFLLKRFLRDAEDAYREELSIELILQNFVSDFLGSSRSNGSDERDFAEQWFQRTYLAWPKEREDER